MNTMTRFLGAVMGMALLSAGAVNAAGPEMKEFLHAREGRWRGTVTERFLMNDGSIRELNKSVKQDVEYERYHRSWSFYTSKYFNGPYPEQDVFYMGVDGDALLVGHEVRPYEVMQVLESTPSTLVYSLKRRSPPTWRTYTYTYRSELVGPGHVRAHNTVTFGNLVVSEETYDLHQD